MPHDELRWIDGPKLAAWIAERHPNGSGWEDNRKRRVRQWRDGTKASIGAADRMMIYLGRSLDEIPAEFWCKPTPRRRTTGLPDVTRRAAAAAAMNGESKASVARRYGVSPRTVLDWVRRFG